MPSSIGGPKAHELLHTTYAPRLTCLDAPGVPTQRDGHRETRELGVVKAPGEERAQSTSDPRAALFQMVNAAREALASIGEIDPAAIAASGRRETPR